MELSKLPVYKLWLAKFSLSAYQLTEAQQQEYMQKHNESFTKAGGKDLLTVQMDWSNEVFDSFGIQEFPSLDALMEHQDGLRRMHWTAYLQSKTYLGWSINAEGNAVALDLKAMAAKPGTRPIYKVALFRQTPHYFEETGKVTAINDQINAAATKSGVETLLGVYVRPNNEGWMAFLLERYPNLDAFYEKYMLMENLGWYKYMEAVSYLGVATSGIISGIQA